MGYISIVASLLFFTAYVHLAVQQSVPPLLLGGSPVLPGLAVRLPKRTLAYLGNVGGKVVTKEVSKLRVPLIQKTIPGGRLNLKDFRIRKFRNPNQYIVSLVPLDKITLSIKDAVVSTSADYEFIAGGGIIPQKTLGTGSATTDIKGLYFTITSQLDRATNGDLRLTVTNCNATFKNFHLDVDVDTGKIPLVNNEAGDRILSRLTKPIFENEMCQEAKGLIEGSLNKQIASLGGKIPLSKATGLVKGKPKKSSDIMGLFADKLKDYVFDFGLTEKPLVYPAPYEFIQTKHKGEISYKGKGDTPFYPLPMVPLSVTEVNQMIYVDVSDYVVNSFLYALHKQRQQGNFKLEINKDTFPEMAENLKTTCNDICLGDIFPEVAKKYPKQDIEIEMTPNSQAYFIAYPGKIVGHIDEKVYIYAKKRSSRRGRTLLMSGDLTVDPEAKLKIQNEKLFGELKLTNFKFPLTSSIIGNPSSLKDFSDLIKELIQAEIDTQLEEGLPIPPIKAIELRHTELDTQYRFIRITSDVQVDKKELATMIRDAVKKGF